jgi:hypothetical protein
MIRLEKLKNLLDLLVDERGSSLNERVSDVSILLYKYCERKVAGSFI